MYHVISPARTGRYSIPPAELEKDFIYLKNNGYTAVTVTDLIKFQEENIPLPEKPVMLTFDDGSRTNYIYAFPLLKQYGFKAVMAVPGKFLDDGYKADGSYNPDNKTSLTYGHIKEMYDSGLIEFQNHSYNMHSHKNRNGMKKRLNESYEDYEAALADDLAKLEKRLEEKAGFRCNAVVFPFGAYSADTFKVIQKLGYKASLTCTEGVNYITRRSDLFMLKRYNRAAGRTAEKILRG
jgi:peptidoglycan/xylan/chitin deacetylase (PgdA/CDA1 family)